jgi:hypothetical protein
MGQNVIVRELECKSILTKSGIESVDYALNPYVGCAHGCVSSSFKSSSSVAPTLSIPTWVARTAACTATLAS